jgi:hypothetical protein
MPLSAMSNSTCVSQRDIHRSSANISTFTRVSHRLFDQPQFITR